MSLQLASLFQDHAVLQRDQTLPVWGRASAGARVRVTLADNTAVTIANTQGDFLVRLPALPAGGPHTLAVSIEGSDERVEVRDLLVGEVWLASGQSNMEMKLAGCRPLTDSDIASADFPAIRFFNVANRAHLGPQRTVEGNWRASTPGTVGSFSAAAFSFARRLHRELGVPIGIISSSWGGSIIQSWLSRSALALNPEAAPWLERYESQVWTSEHWDQMSSPGPDGRVNGAPKDPGNTAVARGWHQPDFNDSGWPVMPVPGTWQSAGHRHSGVYWFRRTVEIPAAWAGRDLHLHFGGIDKQDITYVNGVEVGRTGKDREDQYWNVPRRYTVPASAVTGRSLHIAVRVYSFIYDGGMIGADNDLRIAPADAAGSSCPLAGAWRYQCEHNLGLVTETHLMGHGERNSPHILFDNMLQPLVPYALRGVIWYQGEGNTSQAPLYTRFMRDLVLDWRAQWGRADLAFHTVQLPGFQAAREHQPDSNWARLREAQADTLSLPHTGIAVTIDLGEAGDIHPKNKIPVGERLAQSALARTYARNLTPNGPLFESVVFSGGIARCRFKDTGAGLATTDGQAPRLFFICGVDREFHPAHARIDGNDVVVSLPAISQPTAVRYAWADNPEGCNLANLDGLPASPFRTDRW
ncbi:MAG: 9-O-acetylesterase [Rariglobus sp.]|jgi:sialate O-acetylesterase|nr:9-O-acetylesterase [Rariglobus sp.]